MVKCSRITIIKLITLTILASLSVSVVSFTKLASAETVWSWTSSAPSLFSSTIIPGTPSDSYCKFIHLNRDITGQFSTQDVCYKQGEDIQFGTYYDSSRSIPVASYKYDTKMSRVWGVCDGYIGSCLYLPGRDILVTRQYLINNLVRSLVIYKNFSKRLKPAMRGLTFGYDFDSSYPDYIFQSSTGYQWPVGNVGTSNDSRQLAVEFRDKGIGLLDLDNFSMKRITNVSPKYNSSADPEVELAVSNDGNHVAIMGLNTSFSFYDVNSDCGDEATDDRMDEIKPITKPCVRSNINAGNYISRFKTATMPRFNDNGGELSFYVSSYDSKPREVSLRAYGYNVQALDYLAMGDSFTSGEGETDDKYYLPGTNDEYEKCHVSNRSYPFIVASSSNIDLNLTKNVACSGAMTGDVVGDDYEYYGQDDRLGKGKLALDSSNRVLAQSVAKYSFTPGRVHQKIFANRYNPKIITLGIGGNDIGIMDKLRTCIGVGTCNWATSAEDKEQTAMEIKDLFGTLVQTYQQIHESSPYSKIYVIGYPKVVDENGTCSVLLGNLLDSTERRFMNETVFYLNKIVEAAAQEVGLKYIDIQSSFGEHVLCGVSQPSAMNAIRTGDDNNLIGSADWLKVLGQESFHPNSLGHQYMADSILGNFDNILDYDYCGSGLTICPIDVTVPEPSSYWIPDVHHSLPKQKIASFVFNRDNSVNVYQKTILLKENSLSPSSTVSVEITSEPISLGVFTADGDGAIQVDIDLPVGLETGYHTVHLYGTSFSGESIELYQAIKFIPAENTEIIPGGGASVDGTIAPVDSTSTYNIKENPVGLKLNTIGHSYTKPLFVGEPIELSETSNELGFSAVENAISNIGTKENQAAQAVLGASDAKASPQLQPATESSKHDDINVVAFAIPMAAITVIIAAAALIGRRLLRDK